MVPDIVPADVIGQYENEVGHTVLSVTVKSVSFRLIVVIQPRYDPSRLFPAVGYDWYLEIRFNEFRHFLEV